jgi:hypothetical protein
MNETGKTIGFAVAAVLALAAGVWSHLGPAEEKDPTQKLVGEHLFAEFNPEAAKSMEIIEYDPDTLTLKPFKVAQEKGVWTIPSHEGYPADAAQQLGDAAAALVACEIINVESDELASHVTYGVIDPDPKSLEAGTTGVGKRVVIEDKSNKKLAQVIIGKTIKGQNDLHYARVPGQDRVYVVKLKTDKFSTKFEDWIEKDLLKLNSWDIERVGFNDYSLQELGPQIGIELRSKIQVAFDNKDQKWKLDELEVFDPEKRDYEPQTLADDEELDSQKLNGLKDALDNLKIVDVRRKPEGLAGDLRAGDTLSRNDEARLSLLQRGYHIAQMGDGPREIFSNEGEIRCGTKEGVEYTLRFGRIAGAGEKETKTDDESESAETDAEKKSETKEAGANRFVMVTAQFNEDLLPQPELTPLPGEKPEAEEKKEETQDDAEKTSATESSLSDAAGKLAQADDDETKESLIDDLSPDQKKATAKPGKPADNDGKGEAGKSDEKKTVTAKPKTPEELERERIDKDNERKQKEYDDKVKKGQEKAKELSGRFADWYYVVSDSTFQKIHLGRDEIVKKKTPPADDKKKDGHDHEDDEAEKDVLTREPLPE